VHVGAKDLGTGKEQSMRITAPKKLSKEEIDRMVKESEKFSEEDKKKKESVEVKNQADTLAYSVEKSLKDFGDKVTQDEKLKIEQRLNDLKEAIKGSDMEKIKKEMEELSKVAHKLAEEVYKAAQAKAQKKQQTSGTGSQAGQGKAEEPKKETDGDEVIDAEFKEK